MKTILFNGSPRKNGCTFTALSEVGKALNECGIKTEFIHIGAGPVQGCTECRFCNKNPGSCVLDHEANKLIEAIAAADALVIGAPVYYAAPAGQALALLNRVFYAGGRKFAGKPGAAVISARRAGTTASLDVLNKYFLISNMPLVPSKYWNMVHGNTPEEVAQDLEGLQTMRTLGRNMAWLMRCIAAGREAGIEPPLPEEPNLRTNFIR